jgi:hypothetical protein
MIAEFQTILERQRPLNDLKICWGIMTRAGLHLESQDWPAESCPWSGNSHRISCALLGSFAIGGRRKVG